jgi:hypothetical protein
VTPRGSHVGHGVNDSRHAGGRGRSSRAVGAAASARWLAPAALALLLLLTLAPVASAAVSLTRAELTGSKLRIEGRGALPNTRVTVNGGQPSATSDRSGAFRIQSSSYTPPSDCRVTVSDGSTSATVTLSGCTPSSPPPATLAAPTTLAPANGASVSVPFTISWSAVTHSSGIAGYNWQVSTTSSFATVTLADSTAGTVTHDTVGGLASGTYFWRVQAVSNQPLQQGPWSTVRSFTVTGTTGLAAPTLSLVHGTQFHPWESFGFSWTAVEGAALYELQWSRDSSFPAGSTFKIDNIEDLRTGLTIGDHCNGCEQGTYFARVYALDANRVAGQRSNTVSWMISYDAPVAPPPTPLAPAAGATRTLPIELRWSDAPNPQPMGYEVEVSRNSSFTDIEVHTPQLTNPRTLLLSLTPGTKFWRVRHGQGMSSPTTAAFTDWSPPVSFTVPDTPPAMQAVWLGGPPCENPCTDRLNSGQEIEVSIQLTVAAPAGGVVVTLTSSNPTASGSHPSSVTVPGGTAFTTFRLVAGNVAEPTQVTLTGTLGSSSASAVFTVHPPALKRLSFCCDTTGGFDLPGFLELTGRAPAGGIVVQLASDSPAATPPATVTVPGGSFSVPVPIPTRAVTVPTSVTISATYAGQTVRATHTLWPQQPPSALFLDRTSTTGQEGAWATVRIAEAQTHEVQVAVTSSHPEIARPQPYAQIPIFGVSGSVMINTQPPAVSTTVTITASGAGVTQTTTLTVHPFGGPTAALSTLALSPTSLTGGNSSTGTVTLASAAPAGGTAVALSSGNAAATVPASVTVPAGQTSATFTVSTTSVTATTSATITASAGGATRTATLTVNPQAQAATLTVTASGRSGERVTSSPAGINVAVGSSGSATFATGATITLSATNSRDVIWSGACSSGGNKTKTCTFTLTGNATVTANVQ